MYPDEVRDECDISTIFNHSKHGSTTDQEWKVKRTAVKDTNNISVCFRLKTADATVVNSLNKQRIYLRLRSFSLCKEGGSKFV